MSTIRSAECKSKFPTSLNGVGARDKRLLRLRICGGIPPKFNKLTSAFIADETVWPVWMVIQQDLKLSAKLIPRKCGQH